MERAYSKDTNGITQQVRDESAIEQFGKTLYRKKIRQSGKANVRRLINRSGVSERTLRYDLQRLCDQGVVEKIGSSGPERAMFQGINLINLINLNKPQVSMTNN